MRGEPSGCSDLTKSYSSEHPLVMAEPMWQSRHPGHKREGGTPSGVLSLCMQEIGMLQAFGLSQELIRTGTLTHLTLLLTSPYL